MKLIGIVGSLRKGSFNRMLMENIRKLLPAEVEFDMASIADLPLYSADLDADFPKKAIAFKDAIRSAQGIIIATPEYNRSIPGPLKNAIDWASRPSGDGAWKTKPVLVTGVSTGAIGTAVVQAHLKQVLLHLGMHVLGQPEVHVGLAKEKFDANGVLTDEKTIERLKKALDTFLNFAKKISE